jgi:REP element-mobilizing transposase RayT
MTNSKSVPNASNETTPDRSAGASPAVSGATRPRFREVIIHDRGHIPHWEKDAAIYFITFRLADSLPKSALQQIESERRSIVQTAKQLGRNLTPDEVKKIQRLSTKRIEQYLDNGAGACHLQNPAIARVVAETLLLFEGKRYRLFAWCIMPNHVHVVTRLFPGQILASVVHSWKSYTAKEANKVRHATGSFWQREYYDHLVRDEDELERAVRYVLENPVNAGLKDWPWVAAGGQGARPTAGGAPALPRTGASE